MKAPPGICTSITSLLIIDINLLSNHLLSDNADKGITNALFLVLRPDNTLSLASDSLASRSNILPNAVTFILPSTNNSSTISYLPILDKVFNAPITVSLISLPVT